MPFVCCRPEVNFDIRVGAHHHIPPVASEHIVPVSDT